MLTMTLTCSVGSGLSSIWLGKAYFYDKRGNVIQLKSNNQLNFTTYTLTDTKTVAPDFTGKPLITKVTKVTGSGSGSTNTVLSTITYDAHNSRMLYVDQKYNAQSTVRLAAYTYNELGQAVTKKLGNTSGSAYLQTLDYLYNIHGQLLSINSSKLTGSYSSSLFGMELLYDQTDSNLGNTASYNGRISGVKWMTKADSTASSNTNERSYTYAYDVLNRFTGATYAERSSTSTGSFSTNQHGFDEGNIAYDENGNILALQRNSSTIGGSTHVKVDSLTYNYDSSNPNQLQSVSDGSGSNFTGFGFRNLTGSSSNYSYDTMGNLTADPYKGLTLAYNVLNRTDKITITTATGRYINYTYDAGGQIIRKQQYDGNSLQTTTDYIDGFVYITTSGTTKLSYFPIPEGRAVNSGSSFKPEYVISDQQGNARVSFHDNGSGTAVVLQENSYYAFGLAMANSPIATPTLPNKNLYNGGSEWQNDFSNLPDYYQTFYRNYDTALGRWVAVDPEADKTESMTVYQYGNNNPLFYNDPFGNDSGDPDITGIIASLYSLKYGGMWTKQESQADSGGSGAGGAEGSMYGFKSAGDALQAGAAYADKYGLWGTDGVAESYNAAAEQFAVGGNGYVGLQTHHVMADLITYRALDAVNGYTARWVEFVDEGAVAKSVHQSDGDVANGVATENCFFDPLIPVDKFLSDFWTGATDFPIQPAVTNSTITSIGNTIANVAEKAGNVRGMLAGKALGVLGVIMTMNNDIENHGHLTVGDWTKAGIGVALMFSPVGWFTLGYAMADTVIGVVTGTSITDRIGAGIDNAIGN